MYFYTYVLKSLNKDWFYIGCTTDIVSRLSEHNSGKVRPTKFYKPFDLIFAQITDSRAKTRDLEKYLKIRWNKESLIKLLGN